MIKQWELFMKIDNFELIDGFNEYLWIYICT